MSEEDADILDYLLAYKDEIVGTHWVGCWKHHPRCAVLFAADEILRLRMVNEDLTYKLDKIQRLSGSRVKDYKWRL